MKRIQTAEDIGMTAYQIFGVMFLGAPEIKFRDDEQARILDWFNSALEGNPIGDLEVHRCPIPEFEGEVIEQVDES